MLSVQFVIMYACMLYVCSHLSMFMCGNNTYVTTDAALLHFCTTFLCSTDQDVANIPLGDRPESVLLALLCCGRVEDAVEVAERAGLFRLSMLLCQAGGDDDVLFMLQQQVELWEDQGATSPDLLPEDMLAVYKILGMSRSHVLSISCFTLLV